MESLNWKQLLSEKVIYLKNQQVEVNERSFTGNYNTAFESDYLRLIRSASIRRLQDKTQVFPLDSTDYVRTRLTHSCEVEAFATFIAKQIYRSWKKENPEEMNEDWIDKVTDILSCASFLHDLGNPPFGHYGEEVIQTWFTNHLDTLMLNDGRTLRQSLDEAMIKDLVYFEGNAQTLRIITKLHKQSGNNGMRLTAGVMDAIIKYPCGSDERKKLEGILYKKFSYFQSEKDIFMKIKELTGTGQCRNPLTFILEAADDIAYRFSDLEDGYKKGMYSLAELKKLLQETDVADQAEHPNLKTELEVIEEIEKNAENEKDTVIQWISRKQLYSAGQISKAFLENKEAIMQGTFQQELIEVSSIRNLMDKLKYFSIDKIFNHPDILRQELVGKEILEFLLDRFVEAVLNEKDIMNSQNRLIMLMSQNYKENYERECQKGNPIYARLLLATDYIAGMTDGYAKRLYQELRGIR